MQARDRDGAAGAAFAENDRDARHAQQKRSIGRPRDRFGLAAFFRVHAGKRSGGIDKRNDGQTETVGKLHEAHGLAIAFRPRHAEIMLNSCFGAGAFFLAKDANGTAAKPAETADDRGVLAKLPIARQGREIVHEGLDIIAKMRPLRMPGDLRLLPGRQIGIKIGKRLLGLGFEPGQFLANGNGVALRRELAEFQNLGFEFGDWFFKIEIASHCRRRGYAKDRTRLGAAPKFPSWRHNGIGNSRTETNAKCLIGPWYFRSVETRYFAPRSQEAAPAVRMVWRQNRVKPRAKRFRRSTPRKAR